MRAIIAGAAIAMLAAGVAAQPDPKDDKKFESKEGKFTAKFPTAPVRETKSAGGLTLTLYRSDHEKDKNSYVVIYGEIAADLLKGTKPEQILEGGVKGLTENFKAKVTKSEATTVGDKKYPAREIAADKEDVANPLHIRGKLVLANNRLYQVYVIGSKEFLASKEADAFLTSFDVTE